MIVKTRAKADRRRTYIPKSITNAKKTIYFDDKSAYFVINQIKGQLIANASSGVLWQLPDNKTITNLFKTNQPEFILVGLENTLIVLSDKGLVKEFLFDFFVHGCYFKEQLNKTVTGYLDTAIDGSEKPIPFILALDNLKLVLDY